MVNDGNIFFLARILGKNTFLKHAFEPETASYTATFPQRKYLKNYLGFRLTSVKILNSIILLGLSSHYVTNKTSNENKPNMESSPSPSDFQLPVADPLDRDQNKLGKVSKPPQVKALNEIDRYTLCSNRIV
jgi:hypothetical protein